MSTNVDEFFDALRGRVHSFDVRLETAWAKMRAQQELAETREGINRGNTRQEVQKLEARAERAETYAEDAIAQAAAAIDEVEKAILDAAAARIDADQVGSCPPCIGRGTKR